MAHCRRARFSPAWGLCRRGNRECETFGKPERWSLPSHILPRCMRRVPSSDALIPALYPHGIFTGDFTEALAAIPGPKAAGWSASNIVGLEEGWEAQDEQWTGGDLAGKRHVHGWADGICFNVRLEDQRRCILVLMGALPEGTKELLAVIDAERESKLSSWKKQLNHG